jgi:hypothetical protein
LNANAKKPVAFTTGFSNHSETPAADQVVLTIADSQQAIQRKEAKQKPISWTWRGAQFVRINPGKYMAWCVEWKGPEWVPAYRRYSFRLIFRPVAEDVEVTMFINFGKSSEPPRSMASRYFKAWTMANGEAPLRSQPMVPAVFVEQGLTYTIEIEDASIDPTTKQDRPACLVYSRVKEILSVSRP